MRSRALKPGRLRLAGNRWQPRLQCNRLLSLHIFSLSHKPRPAPQYHKIQRCHGQVL